MIIYISVALAFIMHMLTDEEKKEIEKEQYALKIRRELKAGKKPQGFWGKVWKGLNSTFTIWLLSTVAVGLITFFYAKFQEWSAMKEYDQRIEIEVIERWSAYTQDIAGASTRGDLKAACRLLLPPNLNDHQESVYPEFANRSVPSLLREQYHTRLRWGHDNKHIPMRIIGQLIMDTERILDAPICTDHMSKEDLDSNITQATSEYINEILERNWWHTMRRPYTGLSSN